MATIEEIKNSLLEKCIKEIISYIRQEDEETEECLIEHIALILFIENNINNIKSIIDSMISDVQNGEFDYIHKIEDLLSQEGDFYREFLFDEDSDLFEKMQEFRNQQRNNF